MGTRVIENSARGSRGVHRRTGRRRLLPLIVLGGLLALAATAIAPIAGLLSPATGVPVTYNPDYTCAVPYLNAGQSATIANTGVSVSVTASTAVQGDISATYLYQNYSRISTTLTFSPPVPAIKMVTRNHADAPGRYETLTFTGSGGAFTAAVTNQDGSFIYDSGDEFTGMLSSVGVAYTWDSGAPIFARGSYLDMYISCVGLTPTTQTVNGTTGTPITATSAFTQTGFFGSMTFAITAGTLPTGLSISSTTGVISGTPTAPSSGTVTVTATGSAFGSATSTVNFTITGAPPTPPAPPPAPPAPAPTPPAPAPPEPTTEPAPPAPPAPAQEPVLAIIQNQDNGSVPPGSGVAPGGSLLLVGGAPSGVRVVPDRSVSPTGLDASGDGFTMRLRGLGAKDQPLGLAPDGALVLESSRLAEVSGTGFRPNAPVKVFLFVPARELGTVMTDASGSFTGRVPLPADLPPGRYTLQTNGWTPNGQVRSLSLGVLARPTPSRKFGTVTTVVFFPELSPELTDTAKKTLRKLVKGRAGRTVRTVVVGYVQEDQRTDNNKYLSTMRAVAISRYLKSLGVKGLVTTSGAGIAEQSGPAGRRAAVTIRYTKEATAPA